MSKQYIISLDQGTTSSRAIIFDQSACIVASAHKEFKQYYPKAGCVEHNANELWTSQLQVLKEVIAQSCISFADIKAIGITNQRETTIVWDKATGEPIYPAIVWQCRRTADFCNDLKAKGYEEIVSKKTGLPIDSYFSASKISWILDNVKGAKQRAQNGELLFGTVDTFLMWKLSGGKIHATDYTNASRTLIFDIHNLCWDDELLNIFGIPKCMLPKVYPSSYNYGCCDENIVGAKLKICGVAGDQQSALYGHLCTTKGCGKNTYGTGCFALMNTGDKAIKSKRGLITTLAASFENNKPQYVLEGSVFVGGAVLQWLRDEMKMISSAKEADEISIITPHTNGVYIVPAFVGLGAPHWNSRARGTISGITRGTTREHFVRASLESIAYQVFDVIHAMEADLGIKISSLNVDGGASVSDVLMQFQSDILDTIVVRPKVIESTALGACFLAGICAGVWADENDIKNKCTCSTTFSPKMQKCEREQLILGWEDAVARSKYV